MHRSALTLVLAGMLLATVAATPSVAAASEGAKVVIIVGATHGATEAYRGYADQAYTEAIKYTPNVVKVYSPDATWARVKAAVAGASVVIYMGHGNGWPSPYTNDASYTTKDGFGLNATAGAGDDNNRYYGEPYVSTLELAPGAVVILNHLCYAAGNSEPGYPEPTVSVARQRVDNYAAGFLKAGAAAVIADSHGGPIRYLRDLFTTSQPIESLWAGESPGSGNIVSFPSVRTPGATAFQDPQTPTSGFFRSLVVRSLGSTNDGIGAGGVGDTSADPAVLSIPGNASVSTDAANLFGDIAFGSPPVRTLAAGTRLRVVGGPVAIAPQAAPLVQVQGLDDPTISGYLAVGDLVPRDSTPPILRRLDLAGGSFSPNGDGVADQAVLSGEFSESVDWTLTVADASGTIVIQQAGAGPSLQVVWNPLASGQYVPDGTYTVTVSAVDAWQNRRPATQGTISLDTNAAQLVALTPAPTTISSFSPNGDGYRETVSLTATTSEPGSFAAGVRDAVGTTLRTWSVASSGLPMTITWDGRDAAGNIAPDGRYVITVAPVDAGGNAGIGQERTVNLVTALRAVASSAAVFYPQDLDRLAPTTRLSFRLARPMTVTWTLRDAAARIVDTHLAAVALPAGTQTWLFDGRRTDGTMLPPGRYVSYVVASDGALVVAQSVAFEADAFLITPGDATPGRGQTFTVVVNSAERLAGSPRLSIYEPGVAAWSATLARVSGSTYRATIKLRTGGASGAVRFKVTGVDVKGATQSTTRSYPLH